MHSAFLVDAQEMEQNSKKKWNKTQKLLSTTHPAHESLKVVEMTYRSFLLPSSCEQN